MTQEHEEYLFSTFPNLFPGGRNVDTRVSLMRFGFPGDGWFNLIKDLCDKITATKIPVTVVQVKEKFGTLRFYVQHESKTEEDWKTVQTLISEAEGLSGLTCEWCGVPGRLREGGWWHTLCDACETKYQEGKRKQD